MARTTAVLCVGVLVLGTQIAAAGDQAGRGAQRGPPPRPAAAAPQAAAPPQVTAIAIRVVAPGLGANGSELQPFHESPGTAVALAVQAARGSGIVEVDSHAGKLDVFTDDKGQSLLEEGRVGPFPKVAEDGSVAMVEVEVRARPSAGATSVTVQGTLALTVAAGSKPVRTANVKLQTEYAFKVGTAAMTIGEVKVDEDSTKMTFGLTRTVLSTIREVRFFDAKNVPIESRRTGSGYMNEKASLDYEAKTKDKTVTIEFELWQNPRAIKVPFNVQAGLGLAAGGRASGSSDAPGASKADAPAGKVEKAPGPPPVITAGDGAASPDAVVKQMQTAAPPGRAQVLSVIYPRPPDLRAGSRWRWRSCRWARWTIRRRARNQKELDAFFAKYQVKPPFCVTRTSSSRGRSAGFISGAIAF